MDGANPCFSLRRLLFFFSSSFFLFFLFFFVSFCSLSVDDLTPLIPWLSFLNDDHNDVASTGDLFMLFNRCWIGV